MPKLNHRLPKYRLHRPSGQAIVTLGSKDHYLGPHGTDASKAVYDRLVAEWLANGRQAPIFLGAQPSAILVKELILRFWNHTQNHYRRADGSPTAEVDNYRRLLRMLRRSYGATPASQFGPLALKAIREQMISLGWGRRRVDLIELVIICRACGADAGPETANLVKKIGEMLPRRRKNS